jgi:hypothetical protein
VKMRFAMLLLSAALCLAQADAARMKLGRGSGYGDYKQSATRVDGRPNQAPRELARSVSISVRASIFMSGDFLHSIASYSIPLISGGHHNVVAIGTSSGVDIKESTW